VPGRHGPGHARRPGRPFAESYLTALDHLASAERRSPASKRGYDFCSGGGSTYARDHRTDCLAEWHQTLFDRLAGGPEEGLLDRLPVGDEGVRDVFPAARVGDLG
jgi:hypothetical protein